MAVTGTFDADFEKFKNEVDTSTEKLREMEAEADRVGMAVDKAVDVAPKGGGADPFAASLKSLGSAAATTTTQVGGLAKASADLAQFGIQAVSASEAAASGFLKMGTAAGSAVSSLSVFAQVELARKTFEMAYAVTRAGMEFFELDQHVEKAWGSLLGWGDAAEASAAAAADTLARASAYAGREITKMDEALQILAKHEADRLTALTRSRAVAESTKQFEDWRIEIEQLTASGLLPALTKDIDSHAFSVGELAKRYVISTGALQQLQEQWAAEAAFQKETDRLMAEFIETRDKADKDRKAQQQEWKKVVEDVRGVERNQMADRSVGLLGLSALEQRLSKESLERLGEEARAYEKLTALLKGEVKAAEAINTARNLGPGTADAGLDAATRRDTELNRIAALQQQRPSADLGALILKTWQDFDAMVIAGAGKGGLASPPPVTVNVSGVWDPASVRQITDLFSAEIMRRTGQDRFLPAR
jgi:hypothetical protein